uniref:Uncharacterized protein n=1 Tax=Manihot esculenta TaxID=3983 RepID=A0A2C9VY40_MANES
MTYGMTFFILGEVVSCACQIMPQNTVFDGRDKFGQFY